MDDLTFRLSLIESSGEWVVLCDSPMGRSVSRMPPAFTDDELRTALHQVERSIIRSSSPVATRRAGAPDHVTREFGRRLAAVLLAGEGRVIFDRCRERARRDGRRLRLLLDPVGVSVSRIPWEFAVDPTRGDDYLALRMPVVRSPHVSEPIEPAALEPPLRVLGVLARPTDLPTLDVEREKADIAAAFAAISADLVEITWLPGSRWADLAWAVREERWHVLHYIGHGGFDQELDSGYLELTDDDGRACQISAMDLGRTIADNPDLRLIVLNACESATSGEAGIFSSTAATLLREGVPAVVAMQYEISDPAALAFSAAFYESIARNSPVDAAMTRARETVKMALGSLEWATPVLLLASEEANLFEISKADAVERDVGGTTLKERLRSELEDFVSRHTGSAAGEIPDPSSSAAPPTPAPSRPRGLDSRGSGHTPSAPPSLIRTATWEAVGPTHHVAVGPRDLVALACTEGAVRVWSLHKRQQVARCSTPRGVRPLRLAWGPWPRHVASIQDDATVAIWDLETEVAVKVIRPSASRIRSIAFSNDGRWLAVGSDDGSVRIFNPQGVEARMITLGAAGRDQGAWPSDRQAPTWVCFAPDDRFLLVAWGVLVTMHDVSGVRVTTWSHPSPVSGLAVSDRGVLTTTTDGRLRHWGWDGGVLHELTDIGASRHLALSADGRRFATVTDVGRLSLWAEGGEALGSAQLAGQCIGVDFAANSLVTATHHGILESWRRDLSSE